MNPQTALTTSKRTLRHIERELQRDPRLKSDNTRRGYRHDLAQFETWRAERPMTKLLVEEYAADLQREHKAPASINRVLAAVRWWARKVADLAFEDRTMTKDMREEVSTQAARIIAVEDVTGERAPKGREVKAGELSALMRVCSGDDRGPSNADVRDAALIALAWSTGTRRSELAALTLADVKWTSEDEADVTIKGKGDKVRSAYLYNGAALALRDWLEIRGGAPGPLFTRINKGNKVSTKGLSDEALAQMLTKRADQAGLDALTWHDFRRTFAGNLLDSGADLVTVQKLMGHSSPTTTSNYDRRGDEVKRRAVKALHVPYHKRDRR